MPSNISIYNALQIPGWTNEAELLWLAEQAAKHSRILEVGSWKGRSTRAMADNLSPNARLTAVDTWNGTAEDGHYAELAGKPADWLYYQFMANAGYLLNVYPSRGPSVFTATYYAIRDRTFDMIFIDAAHDYENVKADILAWRRLLEPGGLFCGHDYDAGRPGVVKAVCELIPERYAGPGSIWVAR